MVVERCPLRAMTAQARDGSKTTHHLPFTIHLHGISRAPELKRRGERRGASAARFPSRPTTLFVKLLRRGRRRGADVDVNLMGSAAEQSAAPREESGDDDDQKDHQNGNHARVARAFTVSHVLESSFSVRRPHDAAKLKSPKASTRLKENGASPTFHNSTRTDVPNVCEEKGVPQANCGMWISDCGFRTAGFSSIRNPQSTFRNRKRRA